MTPSRRRTRRIIARTMAGCWIAAAALVFSAAVWTPYPPSDYMWLTPVPDDPTSTPAPASSTPAPAVGPRVSPRPSRSASRSRTPAPAPLGPADFTVVEATAYCSESGTTASGLQVPFHGAHPLIAAGNRWPLHTKLFVPELEVTVSIEDRIGHGSQLDLYLQPRHESWEPGWIGTGTCEQRARRFGRQHLHVAVIGGPGGWSS